jgi:hypothetical protein
MISEKNEVIFVIHSFRITDGDGKQTLATKHKHGKQFIITEDYLYHFIKKFRKK